MRQRPRKSVKQEAWGSPIKDNIHKTKRVIANQCALVRNDPGFLCRLPLMRQPFFIQQKNYEFSENRVEVIDLLCYNVFNCTMGQ